MHVDGCEGCETLLTCPRHARTMRNAHAPKANLLIHGRRYSLRIDDSRRLAFNVSQAVCHALRHLSPTPALKASGRCPKLFRDAR